MKLAWFVPDSAHVFAPVIGWYRVNDVMDPDGFFYPNLPPDSELAFVPSEFWSDREGRSSGAYVVDQSVFPPIVVHT